LRDWSGELKVNDILGIHEDVMKLVKEGKKVDGILSCYRNVTKLNLSENDVREIANASIALSKRLPDMRVAVVALEADVDALSRTWQELSKETGWTSSVFHNRDEALSWLYWKIGITSN
jgi:hypothetical protein